MPRFYFDISTDGVLVRDDEGIVLADWQAARMEAIKALPDIARDELPRDGDRRDITADIWDEAGRLVFTSQLSFTARNMQRLLQTRSPG